VVRLWQLKTDQATLCPLNWLPWDPTSFPSLSLWGTPRTVSPVQSQWVQNIMGIAISSLLGVQHTTLCQAPALEGFLSFLTRLPFFLPLPMDWCSRARSQVPHFSFNAHSWVNLSKPFTLNSTHTHNQMTLKSLWPPSPVTLPKPLSVPKGGLKHDSQRGSSLRLLSAVNSCPVHKHRCHPSTCQCCQLSPLTHTHSSKVKMAALPQLQLRHTQNTSHLLVLVIF
jgi:hypothetical protein